jgi:hypothetical protein
MKVAWYGGGTRRVETASAAGRWYKKGAEPAPIRWAFVRDRDGTHRDEYFYATDPTYDVRRIVETYTGRWSVETTFQETRSELHVQTTRGWSRRTVLRATPCLLGLYSVVAMLYASLPRGRRVGGVAWPGKSVVTFSDALSAVRGWIWAEGVFAHIPDGPSVRKLPPPIREILYAALAPAA